MNIGNDEKRYMLPPDDLVVIGTLSTGVKDYVHNLMNVKQAWKDSKGNGVKVAILDTGRPVHRDIQDAGAWSAYDDYLEDEQGHASHVGGIIAANTKKRHGLLGIAPEVADYYCAVLGPGGYGSVDAIIAGIHTAVDDFGVDIINMSLGFGYGRNKELEAACDYAVDQGVTIFAASGNESTRVGQPACYDSVIAVGAVNRRRRYARFSNYGPEVDFVAGGVDVYSTYLDNKYVRLSGTSMASPALAACGALILSKHRKQGVELSPSELKEHLQRICMDLGSEGRDPKYGEGMPVFGRTDVAPEDRKQSVTSKILSKLRFWRIW